jgi:hypothetical protein
VPQTSPSDRARETIPRVPSPRDAAEHPRADVDPAGPVPARARLADLRREIRAMVAVFGLQE